MRVLVAGDTGVIGRRLVPVLQAAGHDVVGLSRSATGPRPDAEHLSVDALDRDAVLGAVEQARPEAVVHLLTAIPQQLNPRKMAEQFAQTDRLRTDGTRYLLEGAASVGAGRFVAQSIAFAYDPGNGPEPASPANEEEPLWTDPPGQMRPVLDAVRDLEAQTAAAGGLALRFGQLYGPGTGFDADGMITGQVRAGRMPLVGRGSAVFSFTSTHDAATAVAAALDRPATGVLNVVDDDPAPVREWLPELARIVGARPPRRVPAPLARLLVGGWGVAFMTRLRGADNARARLVLDWRPRDASWRQGLARELSGVAAAVGSTVRDG